MRYFPFFPNLEPSKSHLRRCLELGIYSKLLHVICIPPRQIRQCLFEIKRDGDPPILCDTCRGIETSPGQRVLRVVYGRVSGNAYTPLGECTDYDAACGRGMRVPPRLRNPPCGPLMWTSVVQGMGGLDLRWFGPRNVLIELNVGFPGL